MKKYLFLFIIALLTPFSLVHAQNGNDTSNLFQEISQRVFDPNENMYSKIYDNLEQNTNKQAIENIAFQTNLTPDQVERFFTQDTITPEILETCSNLIVESKNDINTEETDVVPLSPEDLLTCKDTIAESFLFEKELLQLEFEMQEEFSATEIWSNGSLADSEFDLVVDLNIIEVILFGNQAVARSAPFQNDGIPDGNEVDISPVIADIINDSETPNNQPQVENIEDIPLGLTPIDIIDFPDNELICRDPEALTFSKIFDENETIKPRQEIERQKATEDFINKNIKGGTYSNLPSFKNSLPEDLCKGGTPMYGGLFCLPEFDWCADAKLNPQNYTDFDFSACVGLEFSINNVQAGNPSINCVNCHVEQINDIMQTLLGFNIVPTKNTKQAWEITHQYLDGAVAGFSFIVLKKPVFRFPTDPFANQNVDFSQSLPNPNPQEPQKLGTYSALTHYREFQKEILKNQGIFDQKEIAPDNTFDEKLLQKVIEFSDISDARDTITANKLQLEESYDIYIKNYYNAQTISHNQKYWEAVQAEMAKMNNYFASFQEQFDRLGDEERSESLSSSLLNSSQTQCR